MQNKKVINQIDHAVKQGVQIHIREDGLVIWIDVDGICVARIITNAFSIEIEDDRNK